MSSTDSGTSTPTLPTTPRPCSSSSPSPSFSSSNTTNQPRSNKHPSPVATSCKVTLKDGDAKAGDPLSQVTNSNPPPPPPPPPAGAAAVLIHHLPDANAQAIASPTIPHNDKPTSGDHDKPPPNSNCQPQCANSPVHVDNQSNNNSNNTTAHLPQAQPSPSTTVAAVLIQHPPDVNNPTVPSHATATSSAPVDNLKHTQNPNHTTSTTDPASPARRPSAPADRLAEKLERARTVATANPYYLGLGPTVRLATAWIRDGRANVLVAKHAAAALAEGLAAHAADPTVVPAPDIPPRVACSIIGTISIDQCFLRADGNFKGFNPALTWQKSFSQTTLSFALGSPPAAYPMLVKDFNTGIATFDTILPKNANIKSGQYAPGLPSKHLRLRHAVFAPRSSDLSEQAAPSDAGVPPEFTIMQWPTYSTQAADALAGILHSHVARPLPAYDLRGDLINPSQYSIALRGATVLLFYNVIHYSISEKRSNGTETTKQQICLDVDYIRVLIPPPHASATKRTAIHLSDPHSNAAKKMRQA